MKKILLTALALLMGTFMYAQRDAAKVPGATPSKDVKTEAVLSAVKAPANVNSTRTTKGDSELTYCTAAFNGSIGTGGTGSYYEWAAVFRPSMYTADDNYITSVDFYSYQAATYTVSIYEGEAAAAVPTAVIYQHQYNVTGASQWVTLPIVNSVVAIDKTKALWVAVGTDQVGYPACYSNEVLTTTDCCMMYFQNEWLAVNELGSFDLAPWMIAANTTSDNPGVQCDVISTFPYFNDFEDFTTNHDCWISIDNDGDGQDWITGTTQSGAFNGYNSSTGLVSKSYDYNGSSVSYDADNYLLSPEFELPAGYMVTLSWYAMSTYAPSYPDHYEVMIAPNGSTDINDFVSVLSEDGPADWAQRTADISAYAGTTVRVVFHHQDYDNYWIVIDNLGIEAAFDCSAYGFPFAESFENGLDCWGNYDEDGDGYTWQLAAGNTGNGAQSYSWGSGGMGSLNPDNWLISPEITIPGGLDEVILAWKVKGASTSFKEHYGVYVSTSGDQPADFTTQVYEGQSTTTTWADVTVDMTAYAGQTIRIAFRHYDSYDKMNFIIDDVEIYEYVEPEPVVCDPITTFPYFNDFENFLDEKDCWIDIDNDGDGYGWFTDTEAYGTGGWGVDGSNCLISQSYENYVGARDADNYLLSPEVVFPANSTVTLSWFELSQDSNYPDWYEVMIAPNGSTEISDFVSIYSDEAASPWTERTADLSAYAGTTVRVVFHHESSDCYMLGIDNMSITVEGGGDPEPECDPITTFPYFNDFENFLDNHDCWVSIDADGDGQDWITGTQVYWEQGVGVDGSHCIASESYNDAASAEYNADNYLLSPEFELPADKTVTLSWKAMGVWGWGDNYSVLIAPNGSTNISDFESVYSEASQYAWTERTVDLTDYAGTTVRVVFRHNDYNKYAILIDDMSITLGGDDPEPDECAITTFPYFNDFENFASEVECWVSIDNDGDGEDWLTGTAQSGMFNGYNYSFGLVSKSYNYDDEAGVGTDLDADNYLVSPEFVLPANGTVTLSWYAMSTGGENWPDYYEVMIAPNGSTNISDFVQILGEDAPIDWEERTADISAYAGTTVRVVFHHQDFAQYWVVLDNFGVTVEGGDPDECDPITTFPYLNEFEDFLTNHDCWIDIDNDGDGQTWITGTTNYGTMGWGVNASNCLVSQSYDNNVGAYNADNYLVSPEFELPTTVEEALILSWFEQSQDASYPDSYEVLIAPNGSTEIADFVSIYSGVAANPWTERTFDISSYAGQTIRVVFHHQSSDCYMLEIDNMSIYDGQGPEPVECDPITDFPYFNDFENFLAEKDCWIDIDNDGDGQTWFTGTTNYWGSGFGVDGSNCLVSQSYDNYVGAFDADNYLVSPEFVLPAGEDIKLSWYAQAQDPDYPDSYEVMIAPNGSTNISDFVSVYGEVSTNPWAERYVDISAYAGTTIRVVFHHQDYDNYFVEIDNMGIEVYTGVNEDNDTEFAVYPNPVKNTMTLTGVEVGTEVRIYDLSGSMVMNFVYEGQIVNVENLANGVYVLRANDSMIKIVK